MISLNLLYSAADDAITVSKTKDATSHTITIFQRRVFDAFVFQLAHKYGKPDQHDRSITFRCTDMENVSITCYPTKQDPEKMVVNGENESAWIDEKLPSFRDSNTRIPDW